MIGAQSAFGSNIRPLRASQRNVSMVRGRRRRARLSGVPSGPERETSTGDLPPGRNRWPGLAMISVRFEGPIPAGITDRIKVLAADVDPALQMRRVVPLVTFYDDVRMLWRYVAWALTLVTIAVLMLSAAGIYALMSFSVAQR